MENEVIVKKKLGFIPKTILVILFFLLILGCWMHFVEPKLLVVQDYTITSPKLPKTYDGFVIVHFSDIHFGRTTNEKEVQQVINKINECKPDVVLFSGDLFDSYIQLSNNNIEFLKSTFKEIQANLKKYAVLGDNDYLNQEAYKQIMNEAGFEILTGKNQALYYKGNEPIYISGVSSITKEPADYAEAFKKEKEGLQLFLAHEPGVIQDVTNQVDIFFAGHTLGGMIRLPFLNGIIKKNNSLDYEKGFYQNGNNQIYISSGIGTETYSFRFFNPPSIFCYRFVIDEKL